jgi:hypothetical protein
MRMSGGPSPILAHMLAFVGWLTEAIARLGVNRRALEEEIITAITGQVFQRESLFTPFVHMYVITDDFTVRVCTPCA